MPAFAGMTTEDEARAKTLEPRHSSQDTPPRSRGVFRPSSAISSTLQKTEGAGKTGWPHASSLGKYWSGFQSSRNSFRRRAQMHEENSIAGTLSAGKRNSVLRVSHRDQYLLSLVGPIPRSRCRIV